jgi:hypothetical protein
MTIPAAVFLAAAALLWASSLGYLLALEARALFKRRPAPRAAPLPDLAVVIPTLNEAGLIEGKLDDLRRADYPADRMRIVVVDRGSRDGTDAIVLAAAARDGRIRLLSVPEARNKADQLGAVLPLLEEDLVVFSDADAVLEPDCLRALAATLAGDPGTGLVGASVRPASRLPEERIHWRLLNRIWRLEGDVFSCAGFSGVCYAARREALRAMEGDVQAEDIHLGLLVGAHGFSSQICPEAVAIETRVPQTAAEFVRFQKRRGASYLNEIRLFAGGREGGPGRRLARRMRLWQIGATPWLGGAAVVSGAALLPAGRWTVPAAVSLGFLVPALLYIAALSIRAGDAKAWMTGASAVRYCALMLASLAAMTIPSLERGPRGGDGVEGPVRGAEKAAGE